MTMKNTKILFSLILVLVCGFILGGCTGTKTTSVSDSITIDMDALAKNLAETVSFDDELVQIEDEAASVTYNFGGVKTVVYAGSGATAEKVIIVDCESSVGTEAVFKALTDYRASEVKVFKDYNAAEISKLDSCVLRSDGRYVFYCVSNDADKANGMIDTELGIK